MCRSQPDGSSKYVDSGRSDPSESRTSVCNLDQILSSVSSSSDLHPQSPVLHLAAFPAQSNPLQELTDMARHPA